MKLSTNVSLLYFSEVFPSEFRGVGVGAVNFIRRLGTIFAPFTVAFLQANDIQPQISFGAMAIVGILALIPAMETYGKGTSEDISEEEGGSPEEPKA